MSEFEVRVYTPPPSVPTVEINVKLPWEIDVVNGGLELVGGYTQMENLHRRIGDALRSAKAKANL